MKNNLKKIFFGLVVLVFSVSCFAAPRFNLKKAISVISREEGSGTRGAFIELFGIEKKDSNGKKIDHTTDEAAITNSTAVMMTSVAGDMYSIGYVSLGSLNDKVKALKIDGAVASVENINNGSYKISRPFNIVIKENLSPVAEDFVNYILSTEGQKIVSANKYIQVPGKDFTSNKASGKIVVAGSSSVSPVMEKLIEGYGVLNPNVKIELQTSDSTTGVTNAINGTCDIGMASRGLKDSEKAKGVKEIIIAIDGIAVIVNKSNPIDNLTKMQVESIFTGNTTLWNKIK
ncbi:MAG: phosphate ABC transporter substrate-binding protein [Treponema sp.]|jgi:phosphate transport system substrate-binding protein|nr:phosphate ABC transporter substrate-binding protein [Treponema sp.]